MDIDGRLHEAGHLWRESQGPALRAPKLVTSPEKAPPRWWRRGLIPLAASLAVAGMLIGVVSLHGTASSSSPGAHRIGEHLFLGEPPRRSQQPRPLLGLRARLLHHTPRTRLHYHPPLPPPHPPACWTCGR
jgi:hypothetical protein